MTRIKNISFYCKDATTTLNFLNNGILILSDQPKFHLKKNDVIFAIGQKKSHDLRPFTQEQIRRLIAGLPDTFLTLSVARPRRGLAIDLQSLQVSSKYLFPVVVISRHPVVTLLHGGWWWWYVVA